MPEVSFNYDYALEVVQDSSGTTTDLFYTTVSRYTEYNYNTLAPPYFSFYEEDADNDGSAEKIVFDIIIQGVTAANVRNIYLGLTFNYKINNILEESMISMAFFDIRAPNGLGNVNAFGKLDLKQRDPIKYSYSEITKYNTNPLADLTTSSLIDIYSSYQTRRERTEFQGNIVTQPYGDSTEVVLRIELMIPENQEVLYNPGVLESLKSAWIQYCFLFCPIYLLLIDFVLRFMLSHQIIKTHISNNLPEEKDRRWFKKFKELEATRK